MIFSKEDWAMYESSVKRASECFYDYTEAISNFLCGKDALEREHNDLSLHKDFVDLMLRLDMALAKAQANFKERGLSSVE